MAPLKGSPFLRQLERMRAEFQLEIDAIDRVLALVQPGILARKGKRHTGVLAEALAVEELRQEAAPHQSKRRKTTRRQGAGPFSKAGLLKQRQRSEAFLKAFSKTKPRHQSDIKNPNLLVIAPFLRHGYLQRTPEGYLRTDKVYVP